MFKAELFVGAVVMRDNEILLVRQSLGHSLAGQWTIPWGRVDAGESPVSATIREVREEAGVEVCVEGLLGVQELPEPQEGGAALVYLCTHLSPNGQIRAVSDPKAGTDVEDAKHHKVLWRLPDWHRNTSPAWLGAAAIRIRVADSLASRWRHGGGYSTVIHARSTITPQTRKKTCQIKPTFYCETAALRCARG